MTHAFASPQVEAAFAAFADAPRAGLLALRRLILNEADAARALVGPVKECLRWGQPAYLTPQTGAGTTLRLGVSKTESFALFVHCRTRLIADFQATFPDQDRIEGTRAILFDDPAGIDALRHGWLIRRALTYHL